DQHIVLSRYLRRPVFATFGYDHVIGGMAGSLDRSQQRLAHDAAADDRYSLGHDDTILFLLRTRVQTAERLRLKQVSVAALPVRRLSGVDLHHDVALKPALV